MKLVLLFFVFPPVSLSLFGQKAAFETTYEEKTIFQYGNRYLLNGQKLRFRELEMHITNFQTSGVEYKQYKKHSGRAGLLTIAMLGAYVAALTQLGKNDNIALGLGITGFTANLIAIPISGKAKKHLQKSVWLYNKEILR